MPIQSRLIQSNVPIQELKRNRKRKTSLSPCNKLYIQRFQIIYMYIETIFTVPETKVQAVNSETIKKHFVQTNSNFQYHVFRNEHTFESMHEFHCQLSSEKCTTICSCGSLLQATSKILQNRSWSIQL
jgi:hypothetical protein